MKKPDTIQSTVTPVLYPGFGPRSNVARVQRLETGAQRIQRGQLRPSAGSYVRLPVATLTTKINSSQNLDLSKTAIGKRGGVSIHGGNGPFAYTSTTSSITWYWDGTHGSQIPVIQRADGSRVTLPIAGSGLTVTGLAANTTYYFLPFWIVNNLCNIGWVQGTVGVPQIAFVLTDTNNAVTTSFYLLQQSSEGNEPLTAGFMTAATTISGSGGGGAGGGGSTGCVRSGTDIKTLGGLKHTVEVLTESEWVHLRVADGRELWCTYDHPLFDVSHGKRRADELQMGDFLITDIGEQRLVTAEFKNKMCSKYRVRMPTGHLYWANGFLSHNMKAKT